MEYMTIKGIADKYKVSVKTIRNWIKYNNMPSCKIGNVLRFDIEEVDKWIKGKVV